MTEIIKFLSPLVVDPRSGQLSLGRLSWWPVLIVCLVHWNTLSPIHLTLMTTLLAYSQVSKLTHKE